MNSDNDLVALLQVTNAQGQVITNIPKRVNGIGMEQNVVFFSVTSMGLEFGGEYPDGRDKADPIESMRKYVNSQMTTTIVPMIDNLNGMNNIQENKRDSFPNYNSKNMKNNIVKKNSADDSNYQNRSFNTILTYTLKD